MLLRRIDMITAEREQRAVKRLIELIDFCLFFEHLRIQSITFFQRRREEEHERERKEKSWKAEFALYRAQLYM